jgi:hypothetical protein
MNEERIIENLLTIKDADNYPEVDRDCQAGVRSYTQVTTLS